MQSWWWCLSYKLSDEKTFKSLFFPEKDQLLHVLKHFTDKTGKYEIEGTRTYVWQGRIR